MHYRSFILSALALFLAAELAAQYPPGGYPPGGYPPGGYPPGGTYPGGGLPIPRRGKKKTTKQKEEEQALQSLTGMLRQLDDKFVVVEPQDTRIVNLKRSEKTKFLKDGDEIKSTVLKPGDHLQVEYTEDAEGYLYAVNVILEKEGTPQEREQAAEPVDISIQASAAKDDDRPVLRRKDAPEAEKDKADKDKEDDVAKDEKPAPKASTAPAKPVAAAEVPPPAPPEAGLDLDHIPASTSSHQPVDDTDSGPPRLTRGRPARQRASPPQQVAANAPPASERAPAPEPSGEIAPRPIDAPPRPEPVFETERPADPRIEKAREAAATFTESLPNYVCQEQMARFVSTSHVVSWQPQDIVSMDVVYEKGRESYRNLAINGKPVKKNMEELSGSWSTGEFGTLLVDLFSPATAADFKYRRQSRSGGRDAFVFDFDVDHEHSHWHIQVPSQSILPAYRGSVWIDKENGRVLRIEMQAYHLPEAFPEDKIESATDYEYIRISDRQFLLPVHSENLSCQRGTNICSRNVIDFRNYHKYTGEAEIIFGK